MQPDICHALGLHMLQRAHDAVQERFAADKAMIGVQPGSPAPKPISS
jgi:hypothetical protein